MTPQLQSHIEGCQNVVFFYVWGWMEKAYIIIDTFAWYSAEFVGKYQYITHISDSRLFCNSLDYI